MSDIPVVTTNQLSVSFHMRPGRQPPQLPAADLPPPGGVPPQRGGRRRRRRHRPRVQAQQPGREAGPAGGRGRGRSGRRRRRLDGRAGAGISQDEEAGQAQPADGAQAVDHQHGEDQRECPTNIAPWVHLVKSKSPYSNLQQPKF